MIEAGRRGLGRASGVGRFGPTRDIGATIPSAARPKARPGRPIHRLLGSVLEPRQGTERPDGRSVGAATDKRHVREEEEPDLEEDRGHDDVDHEHALDRVKRSLRFGEVAGGLGVAHAAQP
jgi:hypothetical protein